MRDVEVDLKDSKCKYCGNLNYWDGYFCNIEINQPYNLDTLKNHRNVNNIIECDNFKIRKPHERCGFNNNEICLFWCNNCKEND